MSLSYQRRKKSMTREKRMDAYGCANGAVSPYLKLERERRLAIIKRRQQAIEKRMAKERAASGLVRRVFNGFKSRRAS